MCRVCGNRSGNRPFVAREMMFGLRETFDYFECRACGCLQIARIPADLSKYYPHEYYSFRTPSRLKILIKGPWLSDPFAWGTALKRGLCFLPFVRLMPEWMSRARLERGQAVLEVGSGNGARLLAMRRAGFTDLTGIDPFLARESLERDGVKVLRRELKDVSRRFDLVMLHHSLEHMPDQLGTLRESRRVLKPGGAILIRIPIAAHAWKRYGPDWVQLDAPRHLYLHTVGSLKIVADQAGLVVADMFFDSDAFQFWGSEQYARDIPLRDPRSYDESPWRSSFSRAQIAAWERQARDLNGRGEGDSAAFYLREKPGA